MRAREACAPRVFCFLFVCIFACRFVLLFGLDLPYVLPFGLDLPYVLPYTLALCLQLVQPYSLYLPFWTAALPCCIAYVRGFACHMAAVRLLSGLLLVIVFELNVFLVVLLLPGLKNFLHEVIILYRIEHAGNIVLAFHVAVIARL